MYKRILRQMREKVRAKAYVMTVHAEEEMVDDGLTIYDIELVILTGQITERQEDYHTGEWKYLVTGEASGYRLTTVVSKISMSDKLVIITVYLEG